MFVAIDWPGNRPHINPIENYWKLTKEKLVEKSSINLSLLI